MPEFKVDARESTKKQAMLVFLFDILMSSKVYRNKSMSNNPIFGLCSSSKHRQSLNRRYVGT